MDVSSTGSVNGANSSPIRPQAEAAEVQGVGREARNDGGSDDGAAGSAASQGPSVNLEGQLVGSRINVTA